MGTEGARPAALSWADLVCRSARVNTAGSLAEDVAMGGERRQQGDAVGMISSKVCRCVCVAAGSMVGGVFGQVIGKEKAQRSCLIARWRVTLQPAC